MRVPSMPFHRILQPKVPTKERPVVPEVWEAHREVTLILDWVLAEPDTWVFPGLYLRPMGPRLPLADPSCAHEDCLRRDHGSSLYQRLGSRLARIDAVALEYPTKFQASL